MRSALLSLALLGAFVATLAGTPTCLSDAQDALAARIASLTVQVTVTSPAFGAPITKAVTLNLAP